MTRKLTHEEFQEKSRKAHSTPMEYLSVYDGNKSTILIKCLIHDRTFDQVASTHMAGKIACPECLLQKKAKTRKINQENVCGKGFKYCKSCDTCKPFEEFSKARTGSFGLYSKCKCCASEHSKNFRSAEGKQEELNIKSSEYYSCNKDKIAVRTSAYAKNNREIYRKADKEWAARNPSKVQLKVSKRRAAKLKAVPQWFDEEWEEFLVQNIYDLRILRQNAIGKKLNVDHIVPLQSEFVCGLHCSSNLQIITFTENMVKGNRYWPDMWE